MVYGLTNSKKHEKFTSYFSPSSIIVLVLLGGLASFSAHFAWHSHTSRANSASTATDATIFSQLSFWDYSDFSSDVDGPAAANAPVYSYSVIPGGVSSAHSLRAALHRDPIAAAHYVGFRVQDARLIRLTTERRAHVSYRIGDKIYWTRKEIILHAGETLLTDGTHLARTRCGNRIADVPGGPTSPAEPPVEVIDRPTFPHPPEVTGDMLPAPPIWPDGSAPFLLALAPTPQTVNSGGYPYLPVFPCCVTGTTTSSGAHPTPPVPPIGPLPTPPPSSGPLPQPPPVVSPPVAPPTPPVATPEPSTLLLLLVGAAGVSLLKLRRA